MKNKFPKLTFVALLAFAFAPALASAHRPRLVESTQMTVTNPEVSKAYYGELSGEPHIYRINASEPFDLYVNVLVPDIEGQKKDVSALVIKNDDTAHPLATLDGLNFKWKQFFEPFGHDTYWMGPEYKSAGRGRRI